MKMKTPYIKPATSVIVADCVLLAGSISTNSDGSVSSVGVDGDFNEGDYSIY